MRPGPAFVPLAVATAAVLMAAAGAPWPAPQLAEAVEEVVAASAAARPFSITIRDERLGLGEVEAALDTGWATLSRPPGTAPPAAVCPEPAVACATGAAIAPPRGDAVTASAPGAPGPVETVPAALPEPLDGLLTLSGEPATARARPLPAAGAEARSGATTLDLTPARAVVGDLPRARALLRGLGGLGGNGTGRRLADQFEGFLDEATGVTALRAEVAGSFAQTGAVPASATARGGQASIVVAPRPAAETAAGLVAVHVAAAEVAATARDGGAKAEATAPEVRVRVFNVARGRYEERVLSPGPATVCAGSEPVRVCASGGNPQTIEEGRRASATVSDLTLTLFDDPLPQIRVELAGVEAHLVSAPARAPAPADVALAALLALGTAGAILAGLVVGRRRRARAAQPD